MDQDGVWGEGAAHEFVLQAAPEQGGDGVVELLEPSGPVGPQGGQEAAAADAGDDADLVQDVAVVEGSQRPEAEGCGAEPAAGQGEADFCGHWCSPERS